MKVTHLISVWVHFQGTDDNDDDDNDDDFALCLTGQLPTVSTDTVTKTESLSEVSSLSLKYSFRSLNLY